MGYTDGVKQMFGWSQGEASPQSGQNPSLAPPTYLSWAALAKHAPPERTLLPRQKSWPQRPHSCRRVRLADQGTESLTRQRERRQSDGSTQTVGGVRLKENKFVHNLGGEIKP